MKVYAFIPVKNNSKRLPKKNFLKINGRRLYEIVVNNCIKSGCFDKIIISTNSKKIDKKIKYNNKVTVAIREKFLNKRNISVADISVNLIEKFNLRKNDIFFVIYPTAILINSSIIKDSFNKFKSKKTKSMLSVQKYLSSPLKALKIKKNNLVPIFKKDIFKKTSKEYYFSDGGFYWNEVSNFKKYKNFYPKKLKQYVLNYNQNVDLDDYNDLIRLKEIIKLRNIKF